MRHTHGSILEVDSLTELDQRLSRGVRSLSGWHLRSLDLRQVGDLFTRVDVGGALFLGCTFAPGQEARLETAGAVVFPLVPDSPVDSYRGQLYTADDLYDNASYPASFDARVYAWSQQPATSETALAQALHDHAVDEALGQWIRGRRIAGVMGGHAIERGQAAYVDAARLGQRLAQRGLIVATGGGPGAMEAANLGAWMTGHDDEETAQAHALLAQTPSFRPDIGAWAGRAMEVKRRWPGGAESLGIPTWHYGHEPPGAFATAIAKYFRNATREAILLQVCNAGIVFLPGAAGTVQEIFQDACENYYGDASSVAPMVLVGRTHWTEDLPAWPLLQTLSRDRAMESQVHLVDTVDQAAEIIAG